MRLLNTTTRKLQEFLDCRRAPPYAILSHTWADEEVSYFDLEKNQDVEAMRGYQKIRFSCSQALADGLSYAWVDTCCIDKTSSAELSEAINSMHDWYAGAQICYVYLADVSIGGGLEHESDWLPQFEASRWFTRGWTLQELLSPIRLWFLDRDWFAIGFRDEFNDPFDIPGLSDVSQVDAMSNGYIPLASLRCLPGVAHLLSTICSITKIDAAVFNGHTYTGFSVAQRMSWAAGRSTTRIEDEAYCLMGLFGVHMPLMYGEGKFAFMRLQEEIIRCDSDHSILAWSLQPGEGEHESPLLADSPARFAACANIRCCPQRSRCNDTYEMTHSGLRLSIPIVTVKQGIVKYDLGVLECHVGGKSVAIIVLPHGTNGHIFQRYQTYKASAVHRSSEPFAWDWNRDITANFENPGLYFLNPTKNSEPRRSITIVRKDLISQPRSLDQVRTGRLWVRLEPACMNLLSALQCYPEDKWEQGWSKGPSLEPLGGDAWYVGAVSMQNHANGRVYNIVFEVIVSSKWTLIDCGYFRSKLLIIDSVAQSPSLHNSNLETSSGLSLYMKNEEERSNMTEIRVRRELTSVLNPRRICGTLCATLRYEPNLGEEDFSLTIEFASAANSL